MSTFRFIHCSDLHIDSPFKGLGEVHPQLASRLREAAAAAWRNIVDLALREQVDAVLVAGDIFDSADHSLRAQFKFRDGLNRLAAAGIPAFIACGNHDPLDSWTRSLNLPAGVTLFPGDRVETAAVKRDGQTLARVHGISFPRREVRDNLTPHFQRRSVPAGGASGFEVGVLHANVGGDPDHDSYAPCTVEDLAGLGFDYWALGHVHAHRVLRPSRPAVVYCGNSQGRHFRETGARGCCLVTLREGADPEIRFMVTDAARFFEAAVDLSAAGTVDAALDRMGERVDALAGEAGDRPLAVRLTLTGRTCLHKELQGNRVLEYLTEQVETRFEEDRMRVELTDATRGFHDLDQLRSGQDFIADLIALYDQALQELDPSLKAVLDPVFDSWQGGGWVDPPDPAEWRELLSRARDRTLDQLLDTEE
ncbi:MAG: exonuclease SbcCD subunit D [Nitrospinaceae bacterium]